VGDYVLVVRYCVVFVTGRRGFGPGEQEFGYVHVRPGAHMFYWLYYTTAPRDWSETPLVMWLQGGPGASSTSHGNFETIGPLTTDLERRNSSWVGALKSEKQTYSSISFTDGSLSVDRHLQRRMSYLIIFIYLFFCAEISGKLSVERYNILCR